MRYNKVQLIGRICDDVELRSTGGGVFFGKFVLAVDRITKDKDKKLTDFVTCSVWEGVAESVAKYCRKGDPIFVSGELHINVWTGNDGIKRREPQVHVKEVVFLSSRKLSEGMPEGAEERAKREGVPQDYTLEDLEDDEDLPF